MPTSVSSGTGVGSVPAIVTYWLLLIWSALVGGVFWLILHGNPITDVMLGVLSGLIGTQTTLLVAAVSFWVGSSVGQKQAQDRAATDSTTKTNALAQLAGAGSATPPAP